MGLRLLRAAYGIEFLIALVATLDFWGQVGGQGHLDAMAWWWKLGLSLATAATVVKLTAVSARAGGWKTKATLAWVLVILALMIIGAAVTYYYHVHEPMDEQDQDPELTTALRSQRLPSGHPAQSAFLRERPGHPDLARPAREL